MKTVLVEKYGVDQENPENRVVTEMWDFLQTQVRDVRTSVCIYIQPDSIIWSVYFPLCCVLPMKTKLSDFGEYNKKYPPPRDILCIQLLGEYFTHQNASPNTSVILY